MNFIDKLHQEVLKNPGKLVLPEGEDPRVVEAAYTLLNQKLVTKIFVLGKEDKIKSAAAQTGTPLSGLICIDPEKSDLLEKYADDYFEFRKHKGITRDQAVSAVKNVLNFGAMMVRSDEADGMVAGAINATADVLRAAITIVKPAPGMKTVSSCFAMIVPSCSYGADGSFIYSDCGAVPNPTAEQLAYIAIAAADSCRNLLQTEPVVAMLSFSTKGSASDPLVDKVKEATKIARELAPDLCLDGELQADAALLPAVASKKAPESQAAGKANTLIFPDLNAGNIAYKLTERLTGGEAYGPIIQGLSKPVNDLSRGCKASDIVNVAVITQIQSKKHN